MYSKKSRVKNILCSLLLFPVSLLVRKVIYILRSPTETIIGVSDFAPTAQSYLSFMKPSLGKHGGLHLILNPEQLSSLVSGGSVVGEKPLLPDLNPERDPSLAQLMLGIGKALFDCLCFQR